MDDDAQQVDLPRNPRQVRARRRRRRRQIGTLVFLIVAGAVFAAAYLALTGGDDGNEDASGTTQPGGAATSTTKPFFFATYKVTTGVNVREDAGTTFPTVGTVEQGHDVTVLCVKDGQVVDAASGSSAQWLQVAGPWTKGYVSAAYVSTGDDLHANKIPSCTTG